MAGYLAVVEQFAADPGITLDQLRIQSREQHGSPWNTASGPEPFPRSGPARPWSMPSGPRRPGRPRLRRSVGPAGPEHSQTFEQLGTRVRDLAKGLMASGVEPGDRVAVALPRGSDVVAAALAVLAAGAVYIPVDLSYPEERIRVILDDGAPAVVLADAPGSAEGPPTLDVGTLLAAGTGISDDALAQRRPAAGDLGYVLYTSGSTGRPKGVAVTHEALANLYNHHHRTLYSPRFEAAGAETVSVAHIAGLGFDAAWDPMLWMIAGAELHLVADEVRGDAESLAAYCRRHGIDVLETTPSYAGQLLEFGLLDGAAPAQPMVLALGGEAVSAELWNRLASLPEVSAYNFYGPTEFTVDSVTAGSPAEPQRSAAASPTPMPSSWTSTWRLSQPVCRASCTSPAPAWRAATTAAPPRQRRASSPTRSLRTAAGCTAPGTSSAAPRTAHWSSFPHGRAGQGPRLPDRTRRNRDRAGLARRGRPGGRGGRRRTGPPRGGLLHGRRGTGRAPQPWPPRQLPDYMVPALFMKLPAIPLTAHGKLDRKALPAPSAGAGTGQGAAPQTADERTMCGIFAEVLGVDTVTMGDDFFVLGGHSLLAVSMMGGIREAFGTELPLRTLFNEPTPAGLLAAVRRQTGAADSAARRPARPAARTTHRQRLPSPTGWAARTLPGPSRWPCPTRSPACGSSTSWIPAPPTTTSRWPCASPAGWTSGRWPPPSARCSAATRSSGRSTRRPTVCPGS